LSHTHTHTHTNTHKHTHTQTHTNTHTHTHMQVAPYLGRMGDAFGREEVGDFNLHTCLDPAHV